jgi:hypothetical protein
MFSAQRSTVLAGLVALGFTGIAWSVLGLTPAAPAQEQADQAKRAPANERLAKLLKARLEAVDVEIKGRRLEFLAGRGTLDILLEAFKRRLTAQREMGGTSDELIEALEEYLKLTREVHEINEARFKAGRITIAELKQAEYARLEAEIWLERAKAK